MKWLTRTNYKPILLVSVTALVIVVTYRLAPIAQEAAYHNFADQRHLFGIPNCWNVLTNLPFLLIGMTGLSSLKKSTGDKSINRIYAFLFIGILLTGLGSGYYHYQPENHRLVFDRIPMTIAFMSLLSATIAESIDGRTGSLLLVPLLIIGIGSVLYWIYTEDRGAGDLRLYGLVQFYPMLLIPLILILFPAVKYNNGLRQLVMAVLWYVVAKLFESFDKQIYSATGLLSGHSLKHLAAAVSSWYLVELFIKKHLDKTAV